MARIAARIKLGFYPLPLPVADAVADWLTAMSRNAQMKFLDPCCGDGKALARIRERLRAHHGQRYGRYSGCAIATWGIELDQLRAQEAEQHLDQVLCCSFFATTLSTGEAADRGWQFVYINSPYDDESEPNTGKRLRQELLFLRRGTDRLCADGVLVWVIPQYVLARAGVAKYLAEHYDQLHCVRFPDAIWMPPGSQKAVGMYEQFKQVVLFGIKRSRSLPADERVMAQILSWAHLGAALPPIDRTEPLARYEIPNAPSREIKFFLKGSFSPDAAAAKVGVFEKRTQRPQVGVFAEADYWQARFPDPEKVGLSVGHPLHSFKLGYLIVFAVAGIVNRARLTGKDGRRVLVKGHVRKTVSTTISDDGMEIIEKETDRFESSLWCTDIDTMEFIVIETGQGAQVAWDVPHETMSMQAFLANFGDSLMEQVMQLNTPRYTHPEQIPWAREAFAHIKRKPLGKQVEIILAHVHALVNRWRGRSLDEEELLQRIAVVAEMGAGKTYMAIVSAFVADLSACGCTELATKDTQLVPFFPAIVLAPSVMALKWEREIRQTIPNARVLIVQKFGAGQDADDDEEEDERLGATSFDARAAFRAFDPSFTGASLGLVGSVDRAVTVIRTELEDWQRAFNETQAQNLHIRQQIQEGKASEADLAPLPMKPCHVLILTFDVAKMMPQWMSVYHMKAMRSQRKESRKVSLHRYQDEERSPVFVPACPHCFRTLKNDAWQRSLDREDEGDAFWLTQALVEQRREEGKQLGLKVLAAEERRETYLLTLEPYRALVAEREALLLGEEPLDDEEYRASVRVCETLLKRFPDYQALLSTCLLAEDDEQREAAERHRRDYLNQLLLTDEAYRTSIIAQDQRFRELQRGCEERRETFLQHLAERDEAYQELCLEVEEAGRERLHYTYRAEAYQQELTESVSWYLTERELQGSKDHRVKRFCSECGEPLWQYVPKRPKNWSPFSVTKLLPIQQITRGVGRQYVGSRHLEVLPLPGTEHSRSLVTNTTRRRYAMAEYIADRYPDVFHLLIADEVHEGQDGTALDQARQVLAQACKRMLGLTGTASNGYSSSLFRLYYLILSLIRKEFGYHDTGRWIKTHGKMQRKTTSRYDETPTGAGSDSKRKINPGMPVYKEIPGFDAMGMGKVARVSTFTELRDVVKNMVGYKEVIHMVPMGEVLGKAYKDFQEEATKNLRALLSEGDNSGLSPWFYALWIYPDMPWLGFECRTKDGVLLGKAPKLTEETVWPIEEAILKYVDEQIKTGHPVLIYTERTGRYDEQVRLKTLLETYVRGRKGGKLRVAILRSTTTRKTLDREAWLTRAMKDGVEVLICNAALIKTGLDVLFPRIVYKSFPRKTADLRQSSRRSWRPMQTEDVEVAFFVYEDVMALRLLLLIARKVLAALMVEGRIGSEGLVSLGVEEEEEEGEIVGQLAREMVQALSDGTINDTSKLAEMLQQASLEAARIEIQQDQEVGGESNATEILLKAIRQEPLPVLVPVDEASTTPSQDNVIAVPPAQPERYETIIPLPVTVDPGAILAEAGEDFWTLLRATYGVGGKKKTPKSGKTTKKGKKSKVSS